MASVAEDIVRAWRAGTADVACTFRDGLQALEVVERVRRSLNGKGASS